MEKILKGEGLVYEPDKYVNNFRQFESIISFAKNVFSRKISLDDTDKDQSDLSNKFIGFNKITRTRDIEKRKLKILLKTQMHLIKVEKWFPMLLKVEYFHYNQLKGQVI